MAHDAFISYSSQDKTTADAVCASLEGRKMRCWIAPRDVPPGIPWADALVDAIFASRVFVLVFSDGANRSERVIREVAQAIEYGIPVLPLRIEDVELYKGMKFYIQSIHWLDALTPPLEQHLERLGDSVQALLAAKAHGPMPVATPRPVEPVPSRREAGAERELDWRRRPLPVWAAVAIGLLLVTAVAIGTWQVATHRRDAPAVAPTAVPASTPESTTAAAGPLFPPMSAKPEATAPNVKPTTAPAPTTLFATTAPSIVIPYCDQARAQGLITGTTYLCMVSEPGEWIAVGENWIVTSQDTFFQLGYVTGAPAAFVNVIDDTYWVLEFAAGEGALVPGVYEDAIGTVFRGDKNGFNTEGGYRGCTRQTGRFEILEMGYDSENVLRSFAANFEQVCEGTPPALFGYIRVASSTP